MMKSITQWYETRISVSENELKRVKQRIFRISMLRVALFLAGIIGIIFFFHSDASSYHL